MITYSSFCHQRCIFDLLLSELLENLRGFGFIQGCFWAKLSLKPIYQQQNHKFKWSYLYNRTSSDRQAYIYTYCLMNKLLPFSKERYFQIFVSIFFLLSNTYSSFLSIFSRHLYHLSSIYNHSCIVMKHLSLKQE